MATARKGRPKLELHAETRRVTKSPGYNEVPVLFYQVARIFGNKARGLRILVGWLSLDSPPVGAEIGTLSWLAEIVREESSRG
jgi:hypothetical protein